MFIDEAKIFVRAGRGGNGCVSFRREKYVPKGGPDGGDGGNGACIIIRADASLHTLIDLQYKTHHIGKNGAHGKGDNKRGKDAPNYIIKVPEGTVIKDAESVEVVADLSVDGQETTIAKGGRGGRGNAAFKSSTNQAPRKCETGEPGRERWLHLELKLLADVGIVGFPNSGKSTLLSRISDARPKIAPYPFTTIEPNLGAVVLADGMSFIAADVPGLIKDSHKGKGLGIKFLRHTERTRLLIHLIDFSAGAGDDFINPVELYTNLNAELRAYSAELGRRPQIVAATKIDLPEAGARFAKYKGVFRKLGVDITPVSALTGQGIDGLLEKVCDKLRLIA